MSLTMGTGPFGHAPAGAFNVEIPRDGLVYAEPSPRRMRGQLGGDTVVDSRRAQLVYEHRRLPRYYFPRGDVRVDLLEPDGRESMHAQLGRTIHYALRAVPDAAWEHVEPPPALARLAGHVSLRWTALDGWLEEDEPAIGHARDPYHRVDALATSRHVRASLDGVVLADSRRTVVIFETGMLPRWYFPREDVVAELEPSSVRTTCAYKGHASYWSVRAGGALHENLAWTYREPRDDVAAVAGRVAFFDERADLDVDGERQPRLATPWSRPGWWSAIAEMEARL